MSADSVESCATQAKAWHQARDTAESEHSLVHLLWLPHDRAAQTEPVNSSLEALAWASVTIACDLAKLSLEEARVNESLVTMLRTAIFIDAQFLYWIEGNLSALAEVDEDSHARAIMRTANALFTVKRRRSEEPDIPMALTDTVALRYSRAASPQTPGWQVKAWQLLMDVRYAIAAGAMDPSAGERIERVMTSLDLMAAAEQNNSVIIDEPKSAFMDRPCLILKDYGNAHETRQIVAEAWRTATQTT